MTRGGHTLPAWAALVALGMWLAPGCGKSGVPLLSGGDEEAGAVCPAMAASPAILPGVRPEHRQAAYWIERAPEPDRPLLSPAAVADHNAAFAAQAAAHPDDEPLTHFDLLQEPDAARLARELAERLGYLRERIESGTYVDAQGKPLDAEVRAPFAAPAKLPPLSGELRVALAPIALRCGPRMGGLYKAPDVDVRFDRNSCSTLRSQEPLMVLARWPGDLLLVRSAYALGWIAAGSELSPPIPREHRRAFTAGPHLSVRGARAIQLERGATVAVPDRARLAIHQGRRAIVATAQGFAISQPLGEAEAELTRRPLTRRALLEEAFAYLDTPYGWGGQQGGRDCSRFIMDVLGSFGLAMPRHSGAQAQAGSMRVDVSEVPALADKQALIDAAHERGIVLLHFPGHIMLYLGRSQDKTPMALHAFAEYLERCAEPDGGAGRSETLRTVDRVQVSDLSLGRGTSRRSFLERITHITILGGEPGPALMGVAERRPAAPSARRLGDACSSSDEVTMLVSPERPHPGQPLRVVVSSARDLGSVAISLFDPDGKRHTPPLHTLGGPPFGYWAELPAPAVGEWSAQLGDGERVEACQRFTVHERGPHIRGAGGIVWRPHKSWTPGMENLFSTFVEQLFDYPLDDRTWPRLGELLAQPDKNLLINHRGQNEDAVLALEPDCADLPYFLRAYFAWKLRLPFAYRHCNRGKQGKAPYCDRDLHDHLDKPEGSTEVLAFQHFMRTNLADGVHSGSGRTAPEDDHTDYYPVPLTREAIRPGTMFADPYGHLFVIADWIPQGTGGHGVLVGADAQPDGTVGRRRFWRGSFLFTPDTTEAGAGFKAFRPIRYRGGRMRPMRNAELTPESGMIPFSVEQYRGSADDFYDRVEALINPRPLEPKQVFDVLIQALYEQVKRRVISVDNGEKYKAETRRTIDMPHGHSIFETSGDWEDYSTPSRDMRLLIAIDTVTGFPKVVERHPERFGIAGDQVASAVTELERHLAAQLAARPFEYRRSDGRLQRLTLADVVDRAKAFEMAYNPNDCVEIRWAAPEGSDELSSCRRHAPASQRRRMLEYRSWFATRKRPPR